MFYVPGSAPDVNTDLPSGFSAAMIKRGILVFLKWSESGWDPAGGGGGGGVERGSQPVGRALAAEDVEPVQPL